MTLRRATLLVHALLVMTLVAGALRLLWISVSYVPDPEDPWPVGPGLIAIPMAGVMLAGAGGVALTMRSWMRTGARGALAVGDVGAALTLMVTGVLLPPVVALAAFVTLLIAGGLVAAAKPVVAHGAERSASRPDGPTRMVVVAVIVIAVMVGVLYVAPFLLTMVTLVTFVEPID